MDKRFSPNPHRICLLAGPAFCLLYIVGFVFLCRFWPIPNPAWPAERLVAWILDHKYSYELGCLLMLVGAGLMGPWGASHAVWTRKTEARFPVMYITQIVCLAASVAIFILISIFWGLAAFRAGQINPEITQTIFDLGWFTFLWAGPAFYLWALALGLGILWNPPEHQLFPRWSGWFTVVAVLSWSPGLIYIFWSYGPAAYNGPLPSWVALADYFVWTLTMTVVGWKAINKQEAISRAETDPELGVWPPPDHDLSLGELAPIPTATLPVPAPIATPAGRN
jgi:hypothetical protein